MSALHSPIPWNVIEGDSLLVGDSQALTILDCATPSGARQRVAEANAAFIVKAVNCHDHLVEALQFIADGYDNHDVNHVDFRVKAYQVALDALATIKESA